MHKVVRAKEAQEEVHDQLHEAKTQLEDAEIKRQELQVSSEHTWQQQ